MHPTDARRCCSIRRTANGVVVDWTQGAYNEKVRLRASDNTDRLFVSEHRAMLSIPLAAAKSAVQSPNGKELVLRSFRSHDDRWGGLAFVWCGSCGTRFWHHDRQQVRQFEARCCACLAVPLERDCPAWHAYGRCPRCPVAGTDEVQA